MKSRVEGELSNSGLSYCVASTTGDAPETSDVCELLSIRVEFAGSKIAITTANFGR